MSLTVAPAHATGDVFPASDWNTYIQANINYLIASGGSVASAGTVALTNEFQIITGSTSIANFTLTSPLVGQQLRLLFASPITVQNNGGGTGNIRTLSGADRSVQANEVVSFVWDGTFWREAGPSAGLLFLSTTLIDEVSTVTETDWIGTQGSGFTIPAGTLWVPGDRLVAEMEGDLQVASATTPTMQIRVLLGATVLIDTGAQNPLTGQGTSLKNGTRMEVWLTLTTTGNVVVEVRFSTSQAGGTNQITTGLGAFEPPGTAYGKSWVWISNGPIAVDMTVAQALRVTHKWGTSAATNEARIRSARLRKT